MAENRIGKRNKLIEEIQIRNYQPGDENAICDLFERVFGKPMGKTESLRHWQWEFLENPVKGLLIKLAWDKNKLVGQYAASPMLMYADRRNITAALSKDTMTDPLYGGLGIFRDTAGALFSEQTNAGEGFIYGFPNGNSIHGFINGLQWRKLMPTPVHIRLLRITKSFWQRISKSEQPSSIKGKGSLSHLESFLLKLKSARYKLRLEREFGDWADELWQRCRDQHRLWVIRDKNYLNWRYVNKPENEYNIVSVWKNDTPVGYTVLTCSNRNFGNTLFVLDFMIDLSFQEAADLLIRYVVNVAKCSACVFASVLLSPGSKYRRFFRRNLFLPLPERLFPQPLYFSARCFDASVDYLVNDPKVWSISWGDSDVI